MLKWVRVTLTLISVLGLALVFHWRAMQGIEFTREFSSRGANFFTFWVSGYMVLHGENPYDAVQYLGEHDAFGVTWRPNKIFPYPLPLALLMAPLGLLPYPQAYYLWRLLSLVFIAVTVYVLLRRWKNPALDRLFVPLTILLLFFVPVHLTIQTGSIGALSLLFIVISITLLERGQSLLAGFVLAMTMLKPPQGLTILLLAGVWFLARKDWKAISGVALGGLAILVTGLWMNLHWVWEFLGASKAVMDRTLGAQSNVWAYSYLACKGISPCAEILGFLSALVVLSLGAWFLWRNRKRVSALEAFSAIIPLGFVSTLYLWVYDQILYIIPMVWIIGTLVERQKSYIHAALFLVLLFLTAFAATTLHTLSGRDVWNFPTTMMVGGMTLLLLRGKQVYGLFKVR